MDLIMLANYSDHKTTINGEAIECRRGEVNRSITWLANRWKWNRKKVKGFLDMLDSDGMIQVTTTNRHTNIRLTNYDKYQYLSTSLGTINGTSEPFEISTSSGLRGPSNGTTDGQLIPNRGTTDGQLTDTYKKDKEKIEGSKEYINTRARACENCVSIADRFRPNLNAIRNRAQKAQAGLKEEK